MPLTPQAKTVFETLAAGNSVARDDLTKACWDSDIPAIERQGVISLSLKGLRAAFSQYTDTVSTAQNYPLKILVNEALELK